VTLLLGPADLRPERRGKQTTEIGYEDLKARPQLAVRVVGRAEYRDTAVVIITPPKQGAKE
jgi:hypothetical protein